MVKELIQCEEPLSEELRRPKQVNKSRPKKKAKIEWDF